MLKNTIVIVCVREGFVCVRALGGCERWVAAAWLLGRAGAWL